MQRLLLFILAFIISNTLHSQSIYSNAYLGSSTSFIDTHYDLRDKPPLDLEIGTYFLFGYRHTINKKRKLNLYVQYSKFSPIPTFSLNRNPYTWLTSRGKLIIETYHIDLGLQKKINLSKQKAFLTLAAGIRRSNVKVVWPDNGENWFLGYIHYFGFPGNYYLPQFEIGLDFKIRKRWHFTIMKMYTYGLYGRFQELWFDYKFKGDPLPRTITYINGTTKQFHVGIQFDIIKKNDAISNKKSKKKRKKKKRWKFRK